MKIIVLIVTISLSVLLYEVYQNSFSLERKEVEKYIQNNETVKHKIGDIKKFSVIKSLYTSDYNMLKYFLQGEDKSINLYIYYTYNNKNGLTVKKVELQNISNGSIMRIKE
jgi:hypothetical protein